MTARIAKWALVTASVAHAVGYCAAMPEHIADPAWPAHARFHAVQALVWIVGLDALAVVLAWFGLSGDRRWTRWALAVVGLFAHGSYFAVLLAVPDGRPAPGLAAHIPLAIAAVIFAAALASAWRPRPAAG